LSYSYRTTKPQPQPQPAAASRPARSDRENSFELWLAELVFPPGPEPKHRCEDEPMVHDDNYPVVSEMGLTFFFFFTLKFSTSERERGKNKCFRERTSARSKLSSTHAWLHGGNCPVRHDIPTRGQGGFSRLRGDVGNGHRKVGTNRGSQLSGSLLFCHRSRRN